MAQAIGPTLLKKSLTENIIPAGLSAFITGAPGIGKSDIIRSVAKQTNRDVIDIRASL